MTTARQKTAAAVATRGRLGLAIRAALSFGLIAVLAWHVGTAEIGSHLRAVGWPRIAAATGVLALSVLLVTPRWSLILKMLGHPVPWTSLFESVFLGFFLNQLLPTAVGGDVLRAVRARQLGTTWEAAIHSVLLDRATGVVISLLGAAICLPFASYGDRSDIALSIGAVAALAGLGIAVVAALARWRAIRSPALRGLRDRIASLHDSIWAFRREPPAAAGVFGLAVLNQSLPVMAIWILARGLDIPLPMLDIALVTFVSTLVATIPISLAGWGVREGALVYLFGVYGVAPDRAFVVSILFGFSLTLGAAPGALMLLRRRRETETR